MTNARMGKVAGVLQTAARSGRPAPSDVELLDRVRRVGDDEAFAALVRRHGRAVLAACRHVLADPAEVDDAFQATFVVLFRRVREVNGETVGSWLYAVAHRLAVRARADARRRAARERTAAERRPVAAAAPDPSWREAVGVLHEELDRLPGRYRRVLLLCYLGGQSRDEAACHLGWAPGAVKGCLERGRKMLAGRLVRRGITLSVGLLAVVTGNSAGAGGPPQGLIELTVRSAAGATSPAVAALARGALSMANVVKKGLVCVAVVAGLATLAWAEFGRADPPAGHAKTAAPERAGAADVATTELEGEWLLVGMFDGRRREASFKVRAEQGRYVFRRNKFSMKDWNEESLPGVTFRLDPARSPKCIDITVPETKDHKGGKVLGIYETEKDRLRMCLNWEGTGRPGSFEPAGANGPTVFELVRLTPGGKNVNVPPGPVGPADPASEFGAVLREWAQARKTYREAWAAEKTPGESAAALATWQAKAGPFAERCLKVAEKDPNGLSGLAALFWAVQAAPNLPAGRQALDRLNAGRVARATVDELFDAIDLPHYYSPDHPENQEIVEGLARLVLDRVRRDLNHPRTPRLLGWVATLASGVDSAAPPAYFTAAAELIVARHAGSPDVYHFCEALGRSPAWAAGFEPHLRIILKENKHRHMRAFARFALARVVQLGGEDQQAEAAEEYKRYLKEFDGSDPVWGTEKNMRIESEHELEVLRHLGLGSKAPAIDGVDLDGKPMRLSDFRGKVVLLSFWGTGCAPCLKLVPNERELVARYKDQPFALVGVNSDPPGTDLRSTLDKHQITWRSFKDKQPGKPRIDETYRVTGWPTVFLIDHAGVIRARWAGTPNRKVLDQEVEKLVRAAGRGR